MDELERPLITYLLNDKCLTDKSDNILESLNKEIGIYNNIQQMSLIVCERYHETNNKIPLNIRIKYIYE